MVEIKRTRAGGSFTERRIGVVNVRTGAEKVAEQKAQGYAQISNSMYQDAVSRQKVAGKKAAQKAVTIDPTTGNIKVTKPSAFSLGGFGQQEFANDVQRQYAIAAENDLRVNIKELSARANGDEKVFGELWTELTEKRRAAIEESGGKEYVADFDRISAQMGAAAQTQLRLDNLNAAIEKSKVDFSVYVDNQNMDMTTLYAEGMFEEGDKVYNQTINNIRENKHYSPAERRNVENILTRARAISSVKGSLPEGITSAQLLRLTSEAAGRKWSEQTLKAIPELKNYSKFESDDWDAIEADLRSFQGTVAKQEKAIIDEANAFQAASAGQPTAEQLRIVEKRFKVNLNEIAIHGMGDVDEFVNLTGKLPSQVKGITERILNADPAVLEGLPREQVLDIVKRVESYSKVGTEFGIISRDLGLSKSNALKLDFLSDYVAVNGDQSLEEGIRFMNATATNEDTRQRFVALYGEDAEKDIQKNDNNFTIARKLLAKKRPNLPASVQKDLTSVMITAMQISETPNDALGIFDTYVGQNYTSNSEYMVEGVVTRHSPEQVFGTQFKAPEIVKDQSWTGLPGESDFDKIANKFLADNGYPDLRIKEGAFFKVNEQLTDDKQTVYFLYDKSGLPLSRNGQPLQFNTTRLSNFIKRAQMSEAYRTRVRQTEAERMQSAKEEYDEGLAMGKSFALGL